MDTGVIYIATGDAFVAESETSAGQLREVMPDIDITLFADRPSSTNLFDSFIEIPDPEYDFVDKIQALPETPYDRTLFLDTDVYVHDDISEIFEVLDGFDMAASLDAHQQPVLDESYEAPDVYDGRYAPTPEFNTGVLAYRMTPEVRECLDIWQDAYDSESHWSDQPSFIPSLYESDVRICPLPRRYNYIVGLMNSVSGPVKVFHTRLRGGPGPDTKDISYSELEALIERVNADPGPRVTYPRHGPLTHHTDLDIRPAASIPVRFWQTIRERGLLPAVRVWGGMAVEEYVR